MRHTSGTCSCPKQGAEMTGKRPVGLSGVGFDRRAFRDDNFREGLQGTIFGLECPQGDDIRNLSEAKASTQKRRRWEEGDGCSPWRRRAVEGPRASAPDARRM